MNAIQRTIDSFWSAVALQFLPKWITPNHISLIRLLLLPLLVFFFAVDQLDWLFWLVLLLVLTDSLDGALARQRKIFSRWGKILDPLSDKLLVIILYIVLFFLYPFPGLIAGILLFECIMLTGGIVFGALYGKEVISESVFVSKLKAFCQFFGGVFALLYVLLYGSFWFTAAMALLTAALFLSAISIALFFIKLVTTFSRI